MGYSESFIGSNAPLNAVTASTTSVGFDVSQRTQFSVQFIASGITSGNGVFSIDASNDATNWTTGIAFQDATATASNTWVTSKTLSSNTNAMGFLPLNPYKIIRIKVVRTTDGTYSAVLQTKE